MNKPSALLGSSPTATPASCPGVARARWRTTDQHCRHRCAARAARPVRQLLSKLRPRWPPGPAPARLRPWRSPRRPPRRGPTGPAACRSITRPALPRERVQLNAAGLVELKFEAPLCDGLAGRAWPTAGPFARHKQLTGLFVSGLSTRHLAMSLQAIMHGAVRAFIAVAAPPRSTLRGVPTAAIPAGRPYPPEGAARGRCPTRPELGPGAAVSPGHVPRQAPAGRSLPGQSLPGQR